MILSLNQVIGTFVSIDSLLSMSCLVSPLRDRIYIVICLIVQFTFSDDMKDVVHEKQFKMMDPCKTPFNRFK